MRLQYLVRSLAACATVAVLAGCTTSDTHPFFEDAVEEPVGSQTTPYVPTDTRFRVSGPATGYTGSVNALTQTEFYVGRGNAPRATPPVRVASATEEGDITLNFVDVPITDVVDVVIGDILEENYSISPNVQGTVTARTSAPLRREDLLPILENLLALKGASLIKVQGVWHIVPFEEGRRLPNVVVSPDRSLNGDGQGIHFIPLQNVAVASVINVVSSQITPGRQLVGDDERNLIIFVGPAQEARAIEDMVAVLDIDALSDKLFALIPVEVTPVDEIIANLEEVFAGSAKETIRFVPIERLNAVLAIARQGDLLTRAQSWVARFDRANIRADRQVFVYYVKNGRANELAAILDELFQERGRGSGSLRNVAPGLEEVAIGFAPEEDEGAEAGYDSTNDPTRGDRKIVGPKIIADERNNALVVMGTAEEYYKIEAILSRIDIVPLQVLIEVVVAEVSLDGKLEHGVEWFLQSGDFSFTFSTLSSGAVTNSFPGFGFSFETVSAKAVLNALETVTDVDVISSPKLMVLDNQSARLQVGDQVPIVTRTAVSAENPDAPIVNTVTMVDTGVILEVTPTVNTGGLVSLSITQEVSEATTTNTSDIDSPTIQTRKINSNLAVQSGETVALAGLMRNRHEIGETGIPIVRKIPVLGNLFKKNTKKKERTELLVLITPRVVRDPNEMRQVTSELRQKLSPISAPPL